MSKENHQEKIMSIANNIENKIKSVEINSRSVVGYQKFEGNQNQII